jgi:hypothetical protein
MTMQLQFKNDIVWGTFHRSMDPIGNIRRGVLRESHGTTVGSGNVLGNYENGVIRKSSSPSAGTGTIIGNVYRGTVYEGWSERPGTGREICSVADLNIPGMEDEDPAEMVAAYHFFIHPVFHDR